MTIKIDIRCPKECLNESYHDMMRMTNYAYVGDSKWIETTMFLQNWGNTAYGHDAMFVGSAFTPAYVVVFYVYPERKAYVYSGGKFLYAIDSPNNLFYSHMMSHTMLEFRHHSDYKN